MNGAAGTRIKARREELHIERADMAREVGLSAYGLAKIEEGETKSPKVGTLRAIAAYLAIPLTELLEIPTDGEGVASYEPVDPDLQGVQVNLKRLKELSPDDVKVVDRVVQSMLKEAEELDRERRRAKSKRSNPEPPGQSD